jgi:hypothetical protein
LVLSGIKDAAQEDVLPPKRQEETRIVLVDLSGAFRCVVRSGQAGGGIGDGRAVPWEGVKLRAAGVLHFRAVPVRGTGGTQGKDESDRRPEVVNHGAGNLVVTMHSREQGGPHFLEVEQMGVTREGFGEARVPDGGRAASDGEGTSAADRVEVLTLGEGKDHLVPKGSRDGVIKDRGDTGFLAGFMELCTLLRLEASSSVE